MNRASGLPVAQTSQPVRIAHVNWSDSIGGAAKVASRLRKQLNDAGEFEVDLLAANIACSSDSVRIANDPYSTQGKLAGRLDRLPLAAYPHRSPSPFSVNWLPTSGRARLLDKYRLVHLHWIGGGVLNVSSLRRLDVPLVWTLHDIWPLSGGCHIEYLCSRLAVGCGACPALGSSEERDLSRRSVRRKRGIYAQSDLTFVAPSRWMAGIAARSPLLAGHSLRVIPNGVDITVFKPHDRDLARQRLGLDPRSFYVLFGAVNSTADPNKGYDLLLQALSDIAVSIASENIVLIVFGSSDVADMTSIGVRTIAVGHVSSEDELAFLYAACDVTVVPSRLESFGQTALESIACGTPVVAFAGSGVAEVVEHGTTGYLAEPYDTIDLARGILSWKRPVDMQAVRSRCADSAAHRFSIKSVADQYAALYHELID